MLFFLTVMKFLSAYLTSHSFGLRHQERKSPLLPRTFPPHHRIFLLFRKTSSLLHLPLLSLHRVQRLPRKPFLQASYPYLILRQRAISVQQLISTKIFASMLSKTCLRKIIGLWGSHTALILFQLPSGAMLRDSASSIAISFYSLPCWLYCSPSFFPVFS